MTADGSPKISDFGLAKIVDADGEQTHTGQILGTPPYMVPEQAEGRIGDIGPATDVYARGAILYEAQVGRPPFAGGSVQEILRRVRETEPVSPRKLQPQVPRDLETICLRCLQKEPGKRYATAAAPADDLLFPRISTDPARPVRLWERGIRWARRQPALASLLLVALVGAVGWVIGVSWWHAFRQAREEVEQQRGTVQQYQTDVVKEKAERKKAEEEKRRIQIEEAKKRDRQQAVNYAARIDQTGRDWRGSPEAVLQELEDPAIFPVFLRDFSWGLLHARCRLLEKEPATSVCHLEPGIEAAPGPCHGRVHRSVCPEQQDSRAGRQAVRTT